MDFGLSEEQTLLQDTIRRFVDSDCPPSRTRQIVEGDLPSDPDLWRSLTELGIPGLSIDTSHGGSGLELLDLALVAEVLGWGATPGPFLANAMGAIALSSGDEPSRERWLPGVATGEIVLTLAIGEAGGEWDPDRLQTRAGSGRLRGEKTLVPSADAADVLLVAANDEEGPGVWAVERGAPGLAIERLAGVDGTRPLCHVRLEDTPASKVVAGRTAIDRARDAGLVLIAADASGGAHRCLEMTRDYALTREQFGQPIAAFQGVKHQLANVACDLEPAVSLWWYAAHAFDHITDRAERHAALAKAHLTDLFDTTARYAIELHGGIGFTWEYDLHLWFRRSVFDRAFLGEAAYHRARAADLAGW